ncbi:hypothetical protein DEA8626_01121 [Defluviimonas aquaemixtae]|uniref:Uncharacterized protein n=1 Tax=Albidovulum aquaemixtae TaxID=1542388 RepID=A0A2R8B4P5_9RHOB|nr:hypothetical protein [Defluviimonas aquaemixtae]SPH17598.1 hypothetical protein DEA8626_01121 [Defluviimonas aquaemixtae]
MTCTDCLESRRPTVSSHRRDRAVGAVVLVLLGTFALFASGADAPLPTDRAAQAAAVEDWHGNVRRSHWTP